MLFRSFDVVNSPSLTPQQRQRVQAKLSTRITKDGVLQIHAQRTRSQDLNREDAIARFAELLAGALVQEKARVATSATRASQERRITEKRKRTVLKQARSKGASWDD